MAKADGEGFVDYYGLMQVNPDCDARHLESAYRHLAKMYHPDHAETADVAKFSVSTEAYRILRDPPKRAEYDRAYFSRNHRTFTPHPSEKDLEIDERTAASDAQIHERILLHFYKRRREHAYEPGGVAWLLQEMLECPERNFDFHVWYLKSKGFIDVTEQGTLAITIQGVDHVISTCRTSSAEKLLLAQFEHPES